MDYYSESFELIKVLGLVFSANLLVAIWLIISHYKIYYKWSMSDKLMTGLVVWLGITSLLGVDFKNSFFGQYYRYQGLITLFAYLEIYWIVSKSKFDLSLNKIISISGAINSTYIIGQYLLINFWHQDVYNFYGRMTANLGNPNFAGAFIALASAFNSNWWLEILYLLAIWLTGSRSALLGFGLILAGKIFFKIKSRKIKIGLMAGTVLGLLIFFPQRQMSDFDNRLTIWQKGAEAVLIRPVFGWGVENFSVAFQSRLTNLDFDLKNIRVDKAHNEFLEMAVAGGIPALIIYIAILVTLWNGIIKTRNITLGLCLAGFMVISFLNVMNVNSYLFFYLIAGLGYTRFHE